MPALLKQGRVLLILLFNVYLVEITLLLGEHCIGCHINNNHLYSLHKKTYKAQCIKLPICMHNK